MPEVLAVEPLVHRTAFRARQRYFLLQFLEATDDRLEERKLSLDRSLGC